MGGAAARSYGVVVSGHLAVPVAVQQLGNMN